AAAQREALEELAHLVSALAHRTDLLAIAQETASDWGELQGQMLLCAEAILAASDREALRAATQEAALGELRALLHQLADRNDLAPALLVEAHHNERKARPETVRTCTSTRDTRISAGKRRRSGRARRF